MPDGVASLDALRNVFLVSERAMFEWIVSERKSLEERPQATAIPGTYPCRNARFSASPR